MGIPKHLHAASTSEYMTTDEAAGFLNVKPTVLLRQGGRCERTQERMTGVHRDTPAAIPQRR